MSTGTRAARAATSRLAKQELVRLLFGKQYHRTGPEGHKMLDYSMYSYNDLKKAYLGRLQEIHPDKNKSNECQTTAQEIKHHFHELQNAWDRYEEMAKAMKNVGNTEADFTMFGVGCSFSDNDQERALRHDITDQACRGWFRSAELAAESVQPKTINIKQVSLLDENLFEEMDQEPNKPEPISKDTKKRPPSRRTLIPGLN